MEIRKTENFTYHFIRAKRKTMSLHVDAGGEITVRAPYPMHAETADRFVEEHREWILKRIAVGETIRRARPEYTKEEREKGRTQARIVFEEKCRRFAKLMGVTYGTISIREQKTRWGSCSSKGNLNFNWKVVLMPEEIQDYLVVHELAHRIEMNHSPAFWKIVESVLPDYKVRRNWLKVNGVKY